MEHSILMLSLFVPSFLASDLQVVTSPCMQHLLLASLKTGVVYRYYRKHICDRYIPYHLLDTCYVYFNIFLYCIHHYKSEAVVHLSLSHQHTKQPLKLVLLVLFS